MAHAKKGPSGPRRSAAGRSGTNKSTPHRSAGTSGPTKGLGPTNGKGFYGRRG
jgi:hypothetical protein